MRVHFPLIPGWDLAGVVERVGSSVTEFAPGDEVYGYVREDHVQGGTFAELVAAPVRTLAKKPKSLDWNEAGGLPLVGLTAYQSLRAIGVTKGDTVLVHAASGGVGSIAVQLAKVWGARVIGTGSAASAEPLKSLGAEPVTYGDGLAERVRALAPEGVDAVFDAIGKVRDLSLGLLRNAKPNAPRLVSIAESSVKDVGGRYVFVRPDAAGLAALAELADAGKLRVPVATVLPLARAGEALAQCKEGGARGKIVVSLV
jgi:NADPH:quinone reductase-like Zn-dependent oxidoreductase